MNTIWQYTRGEWEEIAWSLSEACEPAELTQAGWEFHHLLGVSVVLGRANAFLLLLEFDPDSQSRPVPVVCPDLPSYLMFREAFPSLLGSAPALVREQEPAIAEEDAPELPSEKGH